MPTGGDSKPLGAEGFQKLAGANAARRMNEQLRSQAAAAKGEAAAVVGKLGRWSRWDNTEKGEVTQALDAAAKRGDVEIGPGKFEGVHFLSRLEEKPPPWSANGSSLAGLARTVADGGSAAATGVDGKYVVVDDVAVGEVGPDALEKANYPEWTAIQSAGAATTHELGHVTAIQAAGATNPEALADVTERALLAHNLAPETAVEVTGSPYAGASPHEAFAELYARQYAGGGLDSGTLHDFEAIKGDLHAQGARVTDNGYGIPNIDLINPGHKDWAKMLKISEANVKVGRWVQTYTDLVS